MVCQLMALLRRSRGAPFGRPLTVDLEKLELKDFEIADWEPGENRFSYAFCPHETPVSDPAYFEEHYLAWDIAILPLVMPGPDGLIFEGNTDIPDGDSHKQGGTVLQDPVLSDADARIRTGEFRWDSRRIHCRANYSGKPVCLPIGPARLRSRAHVCCAKRSGCNDLRPAPRRSCCWPEKRRA